MLEINHERLWRDLLEFIKDGRVIPVVGPELLAMEIDGTRSLLYPYVAQQLAKQLEIDFEPNDTLNTVVCRYLVKGGQREDIYPELKRIMPPPSRVSLPESLVKLAEMWPLKLFVTTCFDPYLVHALNRVRYAGEAKTRVLEFFPGSNNDLPHALHELPGTTVFHLFGKLSAAPDYAVTDEDVLEFMHDLQSRDSRPKRLFDALVMQNLMVIGCPLSDWLGRFFVRIANKYRLIISRDKTDYLAGDQLFQETHLAQFLRHFSARTKVVPLGSIEFVDELHRRWLETRPEPAPDPQIETENAPFQPTTLHHADVENSMAADDLEPMRKGAVFLSYAHEDQAVVSQIKQAFENAGIEVWFDKTPSALRAGEDFEAIIKSNIERCASFIPVISRHTLTPKARFFRSEWRHAQQIAQMYPDGFRFIIPLVIDDTPPDAPYMDEHLRKLHWERAQDGRIHPTFLGEIKELQRIYRRDNR